MGPKIISFVFYWTDIYSTIKVIKPSKFYCRLRLRASPNAGIEHLLFHLIFWPCFLSVFGELCFVMLTIPGIIICSGSYMCGHFIWNLWSEHSANFKTFVWNDHACKILFIIWLLRMVFIAYKMNIISIKNYALLAGTLSMTFHVRAKLLLHVWS